ncbi:MAG: DoxX family protein [Gemmatimonadaceae bacterium]
MSAALLQSAPSVASSAAAAPSSRGRLAGRILSGLAIAFLTFDVAIKLIPNQMALQGTTTLGYQPHHVAIIGTLGLICLVVYVIPRTAPLGAILWTGYLGGAIATHLRVDNPLFSHILFPTYVAALIWGGLYLRDARVRALVRPTR